MLSHRVEFVAPRRYFRYHIQSRVYDLPAFRLWKVLARFRAIVAHFCRQFGFLLWVQDWSEFGLCRSNCCLFHCRERTNVIKFGRHSDASLGRLHSIFQTDLWNLHTFYASNIFSRISACFCLSIARNKGLAQLHDETVKIWESLRIGSRLQRKCQPWLRYMHAELSTASQRHLRSQRSTHRKITWFRSLFTLYPTAQVRCKPQSPR